MKISIIGYYGANFGDLIMLNVLLSTFEKKYDIINVFTYGDIGILNKVLKKNKGHEKYRVFSLLAPDSLANFISNVRGSTSLNWGGGTCFMDEGGTGGIKFMLIAKTMGLTINYLGIGIDKHKKLKTKIYIALANIISNKMYFRDDVSKNIAKGLSPFGKDKNLLVPDLAYGHESNSDSRAGERYILFCARNLSGYRFSNLVDAIDALVDLTIQIGRHLGIYKIVNLICDYQIDLKEAHRAKDLFLKEGFVVEDINGYDLEKTIDHITHASYVVSVRLHPAVLANNLKVPFAIFNYSDKNLKFVEDVDERDRLIAISDIKEYDVNYSPPSNNVGVSNNIQILDVLNKL